MIVEMSKSAAPNPLKPLPREIVERIERLIDADLARTGEAERLVAEERSMARLSA